MTKADDLIEQLQNAEIEEKILGKRAFLSADDRGKYSQAHEYVLQLQRQIAASEGGEYCVPLHLDFMRDMATPNPRLLHSDYKTVLFYALRKESKSQPFEKGFQPSIISPQKEHTAIAIVEFTHCCSVRFGSPKMMKSSRDIHYMGRD